MMSTSAQWMYQISWQDSHTLVSCMCCIRFNPAQVLLRVLYAAVQQLLNALSMSAQIYLESNGMLQNRFDGMWRKLQTYQNGEELFGLPQTDYPELAQIRKELNLLQKLYKLYNDVIDRVSGYYDIPWGEVNIEEINNELMEFQNRCRKLPKGLKVSLIYYQF